jgi:hypothetical protein
MSKSRDTPKPKIGAGHAEAMFRQGLAELRGAMYTQSNVAQPAQYGLYGTKTPGEVSEARRSDARDMDEERSSVLEDRLNQVGSSREDPGRDDKNLDRE